MDDLGLWAGPLKHQEKTGFWRSPLYWTVLSWLFSSLLPLFNRSRFGDLSNWYGDHLHHAFVTWIALKQGLAVYTHPLSALWSGTGFPFDVHAWGEMPMVYPPGVFAVFLPTALIGRFVPLSQQGFGILSIEYLLLLTHVALWAVLITFTRQPQGSRAAAVMVVWVSLLSLALEGFYDPLFIGAGALMAHHLGQQRPASALRWFGVAALLHYRAACFVPLGALAFWQVLKSRETGRPWKTMVFAGVALLLCLGSFALMYPGTLSFRATHPPVLRPGSVPFWLVIWVSLATAVACFFLADGLVAALVLGCLFLCLVERQNFWWHGAILLAPLISVGAARRPVPHASAARAVLMGFGLTLYPIVWGAAHVLPLFWEISIGFKPGVPW